MRIVDGGWYYGRYWFMVDTGQTVSEYPVIWFDDPFSALEWLGCL